MAAEELGLSVLVMGFREFLAKMSVMNKKIGGVAKNWNVLGRVSGGVGKIVGGVGRILASVARVGLTAFAAAVGGAAFALGKFVKDSLSASMSFESAFAGVIKTTDGLVDSMGNLTAEGENMRDGFRALAKEIPIPIEELAKIGELGGQLGVAKDDLLEFTETVAMLGVTTNLSSEVAATGLAQIGNIMGSTQDDLTRFASSIVALGNNSATTELDIFNFAKRIAGAGAIAGLSEPEIAGIGAAFASVGIEAEAGGTAVQKTIIGINTAVVSGGSKLATFAATAGLSSDEFVDAWETDAAGAFSQFVTGLGDAGDGAIAILEDLGLTDQRLIRSFLSLAGAGDLLTDSIALSNEAFFEGSALTAEAAQRFATTESKVQLLKNTFNDLKIGVGDALLPVFNSLVDSFTTFITDNGPAITAWFENLAVWLGENLPAAMATLQQFFDETWPAIVETVTEVWGTLSEIFTAISTWFEEDGPAALATLQEVWGAMWGYLTEVADIFITWFNENLPLLEAAGENLSTFWTENVVPALDDAWAAIKGIVELALEFILFQIELITGIIAGDWEAVWNTIKDFFSKSWESIKEILTNSLEALLNILGTNTEEFKAQWTSNWEMLKIIAAQKWEDTKTAFSDFLDNMQGAWDGFWAKFEADWTRAWDLLKLILELKVDEIKASWAEFWDNLRAAWDDFWATFIADWTRAWDLLRLIVSMGMLNIIGAILGFIDKFVSAGKDLMTGLKDGIIAMAEELVAAAVGVVQGVIDKVNDLLGNKSPSKVFAAIGRNIGLGLINGINAESENVQDAIKSMVDVSGALGSIGSSIAGLYRKRIVDPIKKDLTETDREVKRMTKAFAKRFGVDDEHVESAIHLAVASGGVTPEMERYLNLLEKRNELEKDYAAEQEKILALEKQQQNLRLLEAQQKLLDLVTENNLSESILDGLQLGLDANLGDIIEATTAAMLEIIASAQEAIGFGSPAKEFIKIGESIMQGLAVGIDSLSRPLSQQLGSLVSPGAGGTSIVNQTTNNSFNLTANSAIRDGGLESEFNFMQMGLK